MRAPPDAATTISGLRVVARAVHGAGDGLAHHCAHRAADKAVLHGADDHLMRAELAHRVQDGVVEAGLLPRLAQPLLVGLHVAEVERIGGAQAAVNQFVAGLEQQVDALPRAELEVVLALGADHQVGLEIGLVDGLAAARAFDPEALGADVFCARSRARVGAAVLGRRRRLELPALALEPRHTVQL